MRNLSRAPVRLGAAVALLLVAIGIAVLPRPWAQYRSVARARVPDIAVSDVRAAALALDPAVVDAAAQVTKISPERVRAAVHAGRVGTTLHVDATGATGASARATADGVLRTIVARLQTEWRAEVARRTARSHRAYTAMTEARDALDGFTRRVGVADPESAYRDASTRLGDLKVARAAADTRGDTAALPDYDTRIATLQQTVFNLDSLRMTMAKLRSDAQSTRTASQRIDGTVTTASFVVAALGSATTTIAVRGDRLRITEPGLAVAVGAALLAAVVLLVGVRSPGSPAPAAAASIPTRAAAPRADRARRLRRRADGPGESVQHVDRRAAEERERLRIARVAELAAAERERARRTQERELAEQIVRDTTSWPAAGSTTLSWQPRPEPKPAPPPATRTERRPAPVPEPAPDPEPAAEQRDVIDVAALDLALREEPGVPPARVTLAQPGAPKPPMTIDLRSASSPNDAGSPRT